MGDAESVKKPVSIIGVLNATPDSFYAGSRVTPSTVAMQAVTFVHEGADYLEIGGESTGPSSKDVSPDDELKRVLPVLEAVKKAKPDVNIAIDTWKSSVASAAIKAGAIVINDVTAGRGDPHLFDVVASSKASLVLMYSKDNSPRTTIADRRYNDVIAEVKEFLSARISAALAAGIPRDRIIIDPGLGHFVSSDPFYSYEILNRLPELTVLGPVLVSPSRKSFLAGPQNLPASERLPATLAATALAVMRGASFVRTHDVGSTKRTLDALSGLRSI